MEAKKKKKSITLHSGFRANKPIVNERHIRRHRHIRRPHSELRPHKLDLNLHLGRVAGGLNRRLEIRRRVTSKNDAASNSGWKTSTVGQHSPRSRHQILLMLKPHKDPPRLELLEPIVEHSERGLESVGLLSRIRVQIRRDFGSAGVRVRQEDAVAGISRRRRRLRLTQSDRNKGGHDEIQDQQPNQAESHG